MVELARDARLAHEASNAARIRLAVLVQDLPRGGAPEGVDEVGVAEDDGRVLVAVDPRYFRPTEVDLLVGDPSLAAETLGWKPRVTFDELVQRMVKHDLRLAEQEAREPR